MASAPETVAAAEDRPRPSTAEPASAAYTPTRAAFRELASQGNVVPVWRDILADMETPVSAFLRIAHRPNAFLLESVEGGERMARYSFFGSDPYATFRSKGATAWITEGDAPAREIELAPGRDPLHVLEEMLAGIRFVPLPGLPRFVGGAVGYIGYDWVRFLEPIGELTTDDLQVDDVHLLLTDTLCIFDHVQHRLRVLANARLGDSASSDSAEVDAAYDAACAKVDALVAVMLAPRPSGISPLPRAHSGYPGERETTQFTSNLTREQYRAMVAQGKEYIAGGDIIQTVLSQRFSRPLDAHTFDVYRALRSLNPSPYMFYLAYDNGVTLVGASPEILVTEDRGQVSVRPIAGTRRRGATPEEDAALGIELLADEKERAEHIMLVDLGRNDIGRVCEYGSVQVDELMVVERYKPCHAHRQQRDRAIGAGSNVVRRAAGDFPSGNAQRRAQGPRDADHRGVGTDPARRLWRRDRLLLVQRQSGRMHHHPHASRQGWHGVCAGGRRHRRRFRRGRRVRGDRQQIESRPPRDRDGGSGTRYRSRRRGDCARHRACLTLGTSGN